MTTVRVMDPIDAVRHPDPYPAYDALAASRALVRCPARGAWIAAHPETVREVLANDACAVRPSAEPLPAGLVGTPVGNVFEQLVRMRDDPARGAVREIVASALAALPEDVVVREAARAARQLVAEAAGAPAARFIAERVAPYTLGRLFGVPSHALPELAQAAMRFAAKLAPAAAAPSDEDSQGKSAAAMATLSARVSETLSPSAGPLGAAFARLAPGSPEIVANAVGLFFQAQDSCAGLVGSALVAIARDPTFRADASERRVRDLVSHVAARDPAIHNTRRFVTREVTLAGQPLVEGDVVLVVLAAAARAKAPELAFGHGQHACPGRELALTLATAAILVVLETADARSFAAAPIRYRASANARIPTFE